MKSFYRLAPSAAPLSAMDIVRAAVDALSPAQSEARLRKDLKEFLGAADVFFVSSGKAALTLTLQAMSDLHGRTRVAIPAYTCYSVPAAVIRAGLEPVLVDVDPDTFDFDESSLKRVLADSELLCVVPTHLFGIPSDIARLREMIGGRETLVLEDAAQAFGLTASDARHSGDATVFSFARGKHLTCGHGGLIAARSEEMARACQARCASLGNAGALQALRLLAELAIMQALIDPRLYWLPAEMPFLGLGETVYDSNFRMTRLPATAWGALRKWRSRLEVANSQRTSVTAAWCRELGITLPTGPAPLLRLPVVLGSQSGRDAFLARAAGLGVSGMYPQPVHRIPELEQRFHGLRFPGAERLATRIATLPTHAYVRPIDRERLAGVWSDTRTPSSNERTQAAPTIC